MTTAGTGRAGPRLRILHVGKFYPPFRGGMETHLSLLSEELKERVELDVLVANRGRQTQHEILDGVAVTRAGTPIMLASTPISPGFLRYLRRGRWDVVHIHLPNPWAVVAFFLARPAGQLVVTYHSDVVRQRVLGTLFAPLLSRFLRRARAIICSSPNYIDSSPVLSQFRPKCRVVPFSIDARPFAVRDHEAVTRIRERYGPRIVLGVGRLIYYKGFRHLVDAMRDVDAHLLIIGEGPLRASLTARAGRLGLEHRITFLGDVESTVPYYQSADVFVLPSIARSEAFGLVQLEAMASGVPVVNTRLASGVPYVSLDRITGLTVPPADADALGAAINALLNDPARARTFGRAAEQRAREQFSLDAMGRETVEIYCEVAEASRPRVPATERQ